MPNTPSENTKQESEHRAEETAKEASPWVDRIARFGYVAKGMVYIVVGLLALEAVTGMGGRTTDPPGALQALRMKVAAPQALIVAS